MTSNPSRFFLLGSTEFYFSLNVKVFSTSKVSYSIYLNRGLFFHRHRNWCDWPWKNFFQLGIGFMFLILRPWCSWMMIFLSGDEGTFESEKIRSDVPLVVRFIIFCRVHFIKNYRTIFQNVKKLNILKD